jgi:hypothetical protein
MRNLWAGTMHETQQNQYATFFKKCEALVILVPKDSEFAKVSKGA